MLDEQRNSNYPATVGEAAFGGIETLCSNTASLIFLRQFRTKSASWKRGMFIETVLKYLKRINLLAIQMRFQTRLDRSRQNKLNKKTFSQ